MSDAKSLEINCPACGRETLLMRRPKYEGFTKVGELLSCTSCGHVFTSEEEVPFKGKSTVKVFTEADRSKDIKVFGANEVEKLCLNCASYVVNPFVQWCAYHKKEVEATDSCDHFSKKPEPKPSP
jgi:hypothetical protein